MVNKRRQSKKRQYLKGGSFRAKVESVVKDIKLMFKTDQELYNKYEYDPEELTRIVARKHRVRKKVAKIALMIAVSSAAVYGVIKVRKQNKKIAQLEKENKDAKENLEKANKEAAKIIKENKDAKENLEKAKKNAKKGIKKLEKANKDKLEEQFEKNKIIDAKNLISIENHKLNIKLKEAKMINDQLKDELKKKRSPKKTNNRKNHRKMDATSSTQVPEKKDRFTMFNPFKRRNKVSPSPTPTQRPRRSDKWTNEAVKNWKLKRQDADFGLDGGRRRSRTKRRKRRSSKKNRRKRKSSRRRKY